jgi:hypothetical protein
MAMVEKGMASPAELIEIDYHRYGVGEAMMG